MKNKFIEHKLVNFFEADSEFKRIQEDIDQGWVLISLIANGKNFVGLLEKNNAPALTDEVTIRIPPRKKIRING